MHAGGTRRRDAVLLTGDLVHDDAAGYAALRAQFGASRSPVHCLPGNHDAAEPMRRELAGPPFVHEFAVRYGNWLIVMLDSTVADAHHGHLSGPQLERLDQCARRECGRSRARLPASPAGAARQPLAR